LTQYRIRRASVRDIQTLVKQRRAMFSEMHSQPRRALDVHDRAFAGWARRETLAGRLQSFLVESANREVVGGGSVWLREVQPHPGFKGGKEPYLMSMYTVPGHRGRGIATLIVKHAVSWAKTRGYRSMSLHASKMGRPLYEELGWKATPEMELDLGKTRKSRPLATGPRSRRSGR
jgi:GNAT superfamily N-acetyltransferase